MKELQTQCLVTKLETVISFCYSKYFKELPNTFTPDRDYKAVLNMSAANFNFSMSKPTSIKFYEGDNLLFELKITYYGWEDPNKDLSKEMFSNINKCITLKKGKTYSFTFATSSENNDFYSSGSLTIIKGGL